MALGDAQEVSQALQHGSYLWVRWIHRRPDFYVEDVTQKWGQINGLGSAPRDYNTDYTDIMPASNPSGTHDPYLSLGAVSLIEEFDGPIRRAGNIVAGAVEGTIEFAKGGFPGGQARALNIFANSEYPSGKPKRNETTGLRESDSIPTNAAKMAAGIPVSATSYATKSRPKVSLICSTQASVE